MRYCNIKISEYCLICPNVLNTPKRPAVISGLNCCAMEINMFSNASSSHLGIRRTGTINFEYEASPLVSIELVVGNVNIICGTYQCIRKWFKNYMLHEKWQGVLRIIYFVVEHWFYNIWLSVQS